MSYESGFRLADRNKIIGLARRCSLGVHRFEQAKDFSGALHHPDLHHASLECQQYVRGRLNKLYEHMSKMG